ncbi:MAG: glutamine amidotransferase [Planctomycetota bacterium]|nr:glutamine amidotransferase [Planctomycetota bacterium]
MTWHPPLSSTTLAVLVLIAMAAMAASYLWSRRELNPLTPAGLLTLALRGSALLLLLFFILQPARLPEAQKIHTKRTLALLIDTSGSMTVPSAGEGSPTRLDLLRDVLTKHRVVGNVTDQANLAIYGFDNRPTPVKADALAALVAGGRQTDLAAAIEQTVKLHQNDDLAGLLLLTDGRNTQGSDPRDPARKLKIPLFCVAIGNDPAATGPAAAKVLKDLAVESVAADPRVILGRPAQVVATVSAKGYGARQVKVELLEGDKVLLTSAVAVSDQQSRRQALLSVKPTSVGVHEYTIRVPLEPGESNPANNLASFKVDVVDPVNRLVYLDRLRQERKFLRPLLAAQPNIRYTAVVQQDAKRVMVDGNDNDMKRDAASLSADQLRGIKAVILGDLPANAFTAEQLASLRDWVDKGGALLVMAGPGSLGAAGLGTTPLASVLPVSLDPAPRYLEQESPVDLTPEGAAHPAFQKVAKTWIKATPLLSRFDVASVKGGATTLMATTDPGKSPVVVSQPFGRGKVAVVLTDSTWRWQLGFDPSNAGPGGSEHAIFWRQLIDWLLPDLTDRSAGASQVQLIADRTQYEMNDSVMLLASVRGGDGTVNEGANVEFAVGTPDGRPIQLTGKFEPAPGGGVYSAKFDAALVGQYDIQVTARANNQPLGSDQIQVRVVEPMLEFRRTDPDRALLRELASLSGGAYLEPAGLDDLVKTAKLEPREVWVQPNAQKDAVPAWDRWWLLSAFIALMAAEWFVRRKNQWV